MVLVNGVEIGRTATIANTSEPLWATDFRLPDELLLGMNQSAKRVRKACSGTKVGTSRPPTPLDTPAPRAVTLEVWDNALEGNPVMLGEVEVPPNLVQDVLSSSSPRGPDTENSRDSPRKTENDDDDHNGGRNIVEGPAKFSGLRLATLNLRSRPAKEFPENSTVPLVAGEAPEEGRSRNGGNLSISLKRMVSAAKPGVDEVVCEHSQSLSEFDRHVDPRAAGRGDDARLGDDIREKTKAEVRGGVMWTAPSLLAPPSGAGSHRFRGTLVFTM